MKTLKTILLALAFTSILIEINAQQKQTTIANSIIEGALSEMNDTIHVSYANVVLYRQNDSTIVTWTISRDDGTFELTKVPSGTYYLVSSLLGYDKNTIRDIIINKPEMKVKLGKIVMHSTTASLGEITVVGERKTVESKIDRKVINVSRDINSTGGTATDLLKNVPNLTVSNDVSVSLRGSSDVSILIDGRPTTIDASNLDQISSSEVESIEIITSPTAKYNPEGKSGIINLRMKQKKNDGFNSNANITTGTGDKYNAGLGINYNSGDVNIFVSYNGIFRKTDSERYLLRESFISDYAHFLQQNSVSNNESKSNKVTLGTNINLNKKNALTLSYSYNPSERIAIDSTLSQYFDRSRSLTGSIVTDNTENIISRAQDYILGYKKTFDKKGEELTVDYNFALTSEKMDQMQVFKYSDFYESAEVFNSSKSGKSNLQINWILPIGESSKLESGIQSIIRGTKIDYYQNNLTEGEWIKDDQFTNDFKYNEQINSVYTTFSGKARLFSYIAGLRLEKSNIDGEQTINTQKINQEFFNLYPTLNLKYSLSENHGLQFSLGRRINRPTARQINPFIDKSNLEVYRSGNPYLRLENVNSVEIGYNGKWKKANTGINLFYNSITDLINNIVVLDSSGISHMYPENVSSGINYGFELTFEIPIVKWWRLSSNGSFYRNVIKSDTSGLSNSNLSYNARLNNLITVDKRTSAQLVAIYTGPIIGITSKMEPQFSVDLAVKRDFMDNKLSLTARITDIFNTLKNTYTAWGTNFTADNWRKPETRVLYLSLIYNFGKNGSSKNTKTNSGNESVHSKEIN